ncbi:MAG: SRPBCC family protein [Bacteroidota bacterium]|nr:SRPBCC family protein [Bacteroidota bacterium]MDP4215889.1 SRPBCC family protein [Bacteroidota bacterium]MDP4246805.1 SRPBCC family protein [Bacteroidota bacterium]MDP4259531.1 SRPBCC family protein [Bacteroidota bacterium]
MRFIKLGLISIFVFFLVLTGLTLLFPSDQRISRAINIAAPRERVLAMVGDLRQWERWNKFTSASGLTHVQFSSPSSGPGAFLRADQLRVGIAAASPDSMRLNWDQSGGKSFRGGFQFLQLRPDSLTVQWWFDFHFRWYPWEKMSSLVFDKDLGPVMEESLNSLKQLMENSP